jgi:hypothetical protein
LCQRRSCPMLEAIGRTDMCGPADYTALHTMICRLLLLSGAGLAGYTLWGTARFLRSLLGKKRTRIPDNP